ncbi:hypothetical protein BDA99DRAFT_510102 [Phascolomyces articulosus]|uniref:Uncharacterized protein n=1 Tax=Phascolomyces articulosus TaxID=60185 RepID=A0AAD5K0P0_9FUNG|nr:hypothetical protein BDA99DRAFT_510102 [Phascolomyces articulosus]
MAYTEEDNKLQQALLETIRQNGRLLDELQAARRREETLIDRCFHLKELLDRKQSLRSGNPCHNNSNSTHWDHLDDKSDAARNTNGKNHNNGNNHMNDHEEELVPWNRVPHYEVIVNGKTKSEAFVANNSSVCFIRESAVKRAGLRPYRLNPPARFKFFGSDQPIVVTEAVNVPMQIGEYRGQSLMFIHEVRSEIILGASWIQSERVFWNVNYMLIGQKKIRVDPKPPILIKKNDPRTNTLDGPVIIERLN